MDGHGEFKKQLLLKDSAKSANLVQMVHTSAVNTGLKGSAGERAHSSVSYDVGEKKGNR